MKKSVNGKSFDEIFAERGKKVEFAEMVSGECYIAIPISAPVCRVIFIFTRTKVKTCIDIVMSDAIDDDGSLFCDKNYRCDIGVSFSDNNIYIATKDQIDLLNSYKTE